MTVWAWDGKTLAADKQATNHGTVARVTKLDKHVTDKGTYLLTGCGEFGVLAAMMAWFKAGQNVADFPKIDDKATLAVVTPRGGLLIYESPFPMGLEEKFYAGGAGRDFALAAMACGKTATEAVEIAIKYEESCGLGVDTLELNDGAGKLQS